MNHSTLPLLYDKPLVVAVSSRALFDLEAENRLFLAEGAEAYAKYQLERLDEPVQPGAAFPLVQQLLGLNHLARSRGHSDLVSVVLASRNAPAVGLRILRTVTSLELGVKRAVFTHGQPVAPYLKALGADLFLSGSLDDVRGALDAGIAAAVLQGALPEGMNSGPADGQIRLAFDCDSVLLSSEADEVFAAGGAEAFDRNEMELAATPLGQGPFAPFLRALCGLRQHLAQWGASDRIRTALVTARSVPAFERALHSLEAHGVGVDEAMFLCGGSKTEILSAFQPAVFFDDSPAHVAAAASLMPAGHVPRAG